MVDKTLMRAGKMFGTLALLMLVAFPVSRHLDAFYNTAKEEYTKEEGCRRVPIYSVWGSGTSKKEIHTIDLYQCFGKLVDEALLNELAWEKRQGKSELKNQLLSVTDGRRPQKGD